MEEREYVDTETRGLGDAETGRLGDAETRGLGDGEIGNKHQHIAPSTQDSALSTQDSAPSTQDSAPSDELERLRGELEGMKARQLESHRRALLAENAGRVVPELVAGATVEELERSVEVARQAFDAAKAVAIAEIVAQQVPTGNPVRHGPNTEGMSPLEKIAYGLKRE